MKNFESLGFDPLQGTSIMSLLAMDATHLSIPRYQGQLNDIVKYFSTKNNPRMEILRILQGKSGSKLDLVWTYVQLQNEKAAKLSELDPEDFDKPVAEEIVAGHMTRDSRKRVQEQIKQKKADIAKKAKETRQSNKEKEILDKAFSETKLNQYEGVLHELDFLDKELSAY